MTLGEVEWGTPSEQPALYSACLVHCRINCRKQRPRSSVVRLSITTEHSGVANSEMLSVSTKTHGERLLVQTLVIYEV